jgi:hypothetical protein
MGGGGYEEESKSNLNMAIKSQNHVRYAVSQRSFFSRGIQALVKRWHTCIERGGDYVEK